MKNPPHVITQQEIMILAQEEKYRVQIEIIRQIATAQGFYTYFFSLLSSERFRSSTRLEVFNYVNELYFELFGEYRYSSYHSFLTARRKK